MRDGICSDSGYAIRTSNKTPPSIPYTYVDAEIRGTSPVPRHLLYHETLAEPQVFFICPMG